MKKKSFVIKFLVFIFAMSLCSTVNALTVSLNELYEIRNDANKLETVTQVSIDANDNLNYVNILSELPNLNNISVSHVSIEDATFINDINNDFIFGVTAGSVNLSGVNNSHITELWFSVAWVYNFSGMHNLSNLKEIHMDCIFNSNDIDYSSLSEFTSLEVIFLEYVGISDYQQFFSSINQLKKLKQLSLKNSNIQNKDVEYLKLNQSIEYLNLSETMITDISFLKEMPNIKSVGLPSHITDFSVLYELDNLIGSDFEHGVWWNNYTEYNVTKELVQYLDNKGINHTRYFPKIRETIDELIEEANVLDTDDDYTKVLKIMKVMQSFATYDGRYNPNEETGGTSLSKIVLLKKGVCDNWSTLTDVLLNIVGVEAYKVTGFLSGYAVHAWNIVKLDGKMYAIDIMNAKPYPSDYFDLSTWKSATKMVMFRDLFRVDSYREIDAINNNLDYNYGYPLYYMETDLYDVTRMLYDFKLADEILNISQKNIWLDLNTDIASLNLVPINGYSYKYYDSLGNIKNTGTAKTGDYIVVTSSMNENYLHKYEIIVEEKTYQIKLESDSFGKNESITVKNGGKYTGLFTPIKYCYKFLGWYTAKSGGTLITEDSIVDVSKVDTLYAHWEFDNKYILTVVPGGLYASMQYIFEPDDIYDNITNITDGWSKPQLYDANYASPEGKKFAGFYTEENGGALITFYSTVVTNSNHEIYAHYVDESEILYTVSINGSEWLIEPGRTVAKLYSPTRTGYTFKYWSVDGINEYDFSTPVTDNITLNAYWDKIEYTLKDILQNNGYAVGSNYVTKFTIGDNVSSIKNKLGNDVTIETDKQIIATGAVIKKGNESYAVVIKGDLTGDGKINSGDLLQMRKYLLEEINLTGAYKEAGIIESNNSIKSLDLLRLRQYLLGEYLFK